MKGDEIVVATDRGNTFRVTEDNEAECRSCGEPIIWCVTAKGKKMPVDGGDTVYWMGALQSLGGTMRYFRSYTDDTLHGLPRHDSGYLVNRKPVVTKFFPARNTKRQTATSTRMGNGFIKKLKGMGL